MTQKRRFKKEYAQELFRVAEMDLETAQILAQAKSSRKENTLFHVQQAIEKGLKAYLCFLEVDVPLVHDLSEILREIPESTEIPHADKVYDLTQFATIRRYEESTFVIEEEEVQAALQAARDILSWVQARV